MNASLFGVRKNKPFHLKRNRSSFSGALFAAAFLSNCGYASSGCSSCFTRSSKIKSSSETFFSGCGAASTSENFNPRADNPEKNPSRYCRCVSFSGSPLMCWMGTGLVLILINVALIALLRFQLLHKLHNRFLAQSAGGFGNRVQRRIHILRHSRCVAADVKMRAFLQPCPKLRGVFEHTVLHVNFLRLIARECRGKPR